MAENTKLELTWIGKEVNYEVEPRILIENTELSNSVQRPSATLFDEVEQSANNMLVHGDNLLALKALEQDFAGKIKCIYIDPPYNTGSAFEQYDDNLEHSKWLSLIKPRLVLLRKLLRDDGSIWISIDDDERDYLKILCDEVFGRNNFITSIIWQKIHSIKNDAKNISVNHDYILVYSKDKNKFTVNLLPRTDEMNARYTNPDNDPRGPWQSGDLVANEVRSNGAYFVTNPKNGLVFTVPAGKHWVYSEENMSKLIIENRVWFGKEGTAFPRKKRFLTEVQDGRTPDTWWTSEEVGHNQEAKRECIKINPNNVFATPKPERLIERIVQISTNPGEIVLDSFLGSGTTIAVAHKMGRKWIGIEMGDHIFSHCKVRIDSVLKGEQGGISRAHNWTGGGSYKFYELASSLINIDEYGQAIINPEYNADMLAAAVSKHEGYTYSPSKEQYWKQAMNGQNSFLFVTTRHISSDFASMISNELHEGEYLLIVCKSFDESINRVYKNLKVKKIPQSLLTNCQFGVENYNLHIVNPPVYEEEEDE